MTSQVQDVDFQLRLLLGTDRSRRVSFPSGDWLLDAIDKLDTLIDLGVQVANNRFEPLFFDRPLRSSPRSWARHMEATPNAS